MNDIGGRCWDGLRRITTIARQLAAGQGDPVALANAIQDEAKRSNTVALEGDTQCKAIAELAAGLNELTDEFPADHTVSMRARVDAQMREEARAWLARHDLDAPNVISVGPIGPIAVEPQVSETRSARSASRIAQSATSSEDLTELVMNHPDPIVRMEAVPRLKARFPNLALARETLMRAVKDSDEGIRSAAIAAVADLAVPGANDLLVDALIDPEPDVRFFAAMGLQQLGDPRAPADPEAFAYRKR